MVVTSIETMQTFPDSQPESDLVTAYCTGTLTAPQQLALAAWLEREPQREAELARLREAWYAMQRPPRPAIDQQVLWHDIVRATRLPEPASGVAVSRGSRANSTKTHGTVTTRWMMRGIAGVFAACAAIWFGVNGLGTFEMRTHPPVAMTEHVTGAGERARFQMPDGTVVQLAPQSVVRYAADFGNIRTVELDGEAVFTVTHVSGTPFVVHAQGTKTQVLGTTFGVRAYALDSLVQVVVAEGRVQVDNGPILTLGDLSVVRLDAVPMVERGVDVTRRMGWMQGRLVFDNTPVARAARDLERWYGLSVTIADPALANRPITAEFEDQPASTVLEILSDVLGARYKRVGNQVTFTTKGAR